MWRCCWCRRTHSDVLITPHHLMCPVHSAGRRRQGHPADGVPVQCIVKQCVRAATSTMSIIAYARSFPCMPILRRSWMSGRKKMAPATNIGSSKYYICYVPRPTCQGSVPLYMPPLAIKGEACNVTRGGSFLPSLDRDSQLSSFHNNPTHSGVVCYTPAARTTLNPCVFMCSVIA